MIIAIDFDGTLCEDKYPDIGKPNEEIIRFVKDQQEKGVKFILWTCRGAEKLNEAVLWCEEQGLVFDSVNDNLQEVVNKWQMNVRKVYADIYIDDKALSVEELHERIRSRFED